MKEFVIHVGLPRCASTFLQCSLFPKLDGVEVYGANNQTLHFYSQFRDDKINLLTDENFLGCPIRLKNLNETKQVLINRLSVLFPNAKIIIIFREQDQWMKSVHKEYIKVGGIETFEDFCIHVLTPHYIDFQETLTLLRKKFDEVLTLQYENLKINSDDFIKEICDFIGTEIPEYDKNPLNIAITDKQINRYRFFNKIFKTKHNPNGKLPMYMNPAFRYQYLLRRYGKT